MCNRLSPLNVLSISRKTSGLTSGKMAARARRASLSLVRSEGCSEARARTLLANEKALDGSTRDDWASFGMDAAEDEDRKSRRLFRPRG